MIDGHPDSGAVSPLLYAELASWWTLVSAPEEYAEEAAFYAAALIDGSKAAPRVVLELGSGGGNNASHMKAHFELTLVDHSEGMLEASRLLNPECDHALGDMRTVRLGKTFDAVFVHDAIDYMTNEPDLRSAMETAFVHCRPGGVALFCPDHLADTFRPSTSEGGHGEVGRAARYLEWSWDPDPSDSTCVTHYAFMLRDDDGSVRLVHDAHTCGLFALDTWTDLLRETGFDVEVREMEHSELDDAMTVFLCRRPE